MGAFSLKSRWSLLLFLLGGELVLWGLLSLTSPSPKINPPLTVAISQERLQWVITYPGADTLLHTPDDDQQPPPFFLPERTFITIELTSKEYIYFFQIPSWNQVEFVMPGKTTLLQFTTPSPQKVSFQGSSLCGRPHGSEGILEIQPVNLFYLQKQK